MKKSIILIVSIFFLFAFFGKVNAQYLESNPTAKQRIFFGGNVGLSLGSSTYVALNPVLGYRLTNRLSAGLGINYTYASYSFYNYKGSMYGASIFSSYTVIKNIGEVLPFYNGVGVLLYGEYSAMNISNYYDFPGTSIEWVGTPMGGIAFQSPIGPKSYMLVMLLYNFNETRISPYPNPIFKVSVQF